MGTADSNVDCEPIRGRFPTLGKLVFVLKKVTRDKMADVISQYVIGCTCHNASMLIGLF